jgi:methanogenic corrinoid protein MtbC1
MKALVDAGWAPSQAAGAAASPADEGPRSAKSDEMSIPTGPGVSAAAPPAGGTFEAYMDRFVEAARVLDERGMEAAVGEAVASVGVDDAVERFVLPAMVAVGRAWAGARLSVAAEHAASGVVMRRLAALYEAAASPGSVDCLVGLPPGSRHEIGALAFAVACRRAGLGVLYLGADVPLESWASAAGRHPGAVVSLGAVTPAEAAAAADVVAALGRAEPKAVIAIGGASRQQAAAGRSGVILLPEDLRSAAAIVREAVSRAAGAL